MSNRLRGEIEIKLGEDTYNCKLNFEATKSSPISVAFELFENFPKVSQVKSLFIILIKA